MNRLATALAFFSGILIVVLIVLVQNKRSHEGETRPISIIAEAGTRNEGVRLFSKLGCGTCHGDKDEGTARGPALLKLEKHWKKEKLVEFLKNPSYFIKKDKRLKAMSTKYFPVQMPEYDMLNSQELYNLAEFLLNLN